MAPAPAPPAASRSICRPRSPTDSCPISIRSTTRCWRGRLRCSSPRRPTRKARSPRRNILTRLKQLADRFGFYHPQRRVLFGNLHQAGAGQRAGMRRAGLRQRGRVPVAVEALEPAGHARRLCRRRQEIPRRVSSSCAMSPRRRCRCRCSMSRSPPTATRRMSRKIAGCTGSSSISPTRSSATATAMRGPPAASASGSTSPRSAATKPAAVRLYRDAGVRVIPGSYLARLQDDGSNPGAGYIRLALVSDSESTAEALHRLVEILE